MGENDTFAAYGHYIEVNGMNMHYIDHGQGYPIVLLHGGTGTGGTTWSNHIPILSQNFRVIVPDCRGRGKTNNPLRKLSYRILAEDIIALCNALNIDKPFICGWSGGGQTALEIGAHFPEIAKGIIAGGVISQITAHYLNVLTGLGMISPGNVNFSQFQENVPGIAERMKSLHTSENDPEYWKKLLEQLSYLWKDPKQYLGDEVEKISIPTLIAIGDHDPFLPIEENVDMFRTIPNTEFCVLPNTAHSIIPLRVAKLLSSVLIDFVERNLE